MTDYDFTEIDGLKIIRRKPGWKAEWEKAVSFLFDKRPVLLNRRCRKALNKYSWLWEDLMQYKQETYNDFFEEFKFYVFHYWLDLYATPDENGVFQPVESDFDPQLVIQSNLPPFILYLLGSIDKCHLADKFVENCTTTANNFNKKKEKAIVAAGKRKGKTKEDIQKDIQQNRLSVQYVSSIKKGNQAEEDDDNSNGSDVLEYKQNPQHQRFQIIKGIVRKYIDYLNIECKDFDESHFISQTERQAGVQLYPEMTDLSLLDSLEVWINSSQKPACNQKGIQWIIQKTLGIIKQNNPNQAPEQTLYDTHQKTILETDCFRDKESEAPDDSITRNPAFNRQFAPITDFDDLRRLFGITTEENARAERSRYTRSVAKWLNQNSKQLKAEFDTDK